MAQLTYAQALALAESDPIKLWAALVAGAGPSGATAGPSGVALPAGTAVIGKVGIDQTTPGTTNQVTATPNIQTVTATLARPTNTTPYTASTALANSTSSPTAGGFTLSNAARAAGGSGEIMDAVVSASAGSAINGELWIFDQAVTALNDAAAFSVSDSDIQNLVGVIPFNTTMLTAANSVSTITGLGLGYTCVGTPNLRFLVKVLSAFTPGNGEVLCVRIKVKN